MNIFEKINYYNRNPQLSGWFTSQLEQLVSFGLYYNDIESLADKLTAELIDYRDANGISNVVIGMSGGIDSAVTAALFKRAGYTVTGVTLPIHQNPAETERGVEACTALGIEHVQVDLTEPYHELTEYYKRLGLDYTADEADLDELKRQGNIRARLRMITLYNLASKLKGFVASTDNFSELSAGFWTLHGDVGDVAPIQSLTKSWEVPALAEFLGVPQSIIEAKPTDGLGIANGDEDQFGFSYLEFDIALLSLMQNLDNDDSWLQGATETDIHIVREVKRRISSTTFKRVNPYNLQHPVHKTRYAQLEMLDEQLKGE